MSSDIARAMINMPATALDGALREATILLSDIRGFTRLAEVIGARQVVGLLGTSISPTWPT